MDDTKRRSKGTGCCLSAAFQDITVAPYSRISALAPLVYDGYQRLRIGTQIALVRTLGWFKVIWPADCSTGMVVSRNLKVCRSK